MSRYSVQRIGHGYGVFDGGKLVVVYTGEWRAEARAERLNRVARQRVRPCMTCGSNFISEGPHNRMCAACKKNV